MKTYNSLTQQRQESKTLNLKRVIKTFFIQENSNLLFKREHDIYGGKFSIIGKLESSRLFLYERKYSNVDLIKHYDLPVCYKKEMEIKD